MFQGIQQILSTNLSLTLDPPAANFVNSCQLQNVAPWKENTLNIFTLHPCDLFASSATPGLFQRQLLFLCSVLDRRAAQQHTDQAIDSGLC